MTPQESLLMAIIKEAVDNIKYQGWADRDKVKARDDAKEFLLGSEYDKTRLEDFLDLWHLDDLSVESVRILARKELELCR